MTSPNPMALDAKALEEAARLTREQTFSALTIDEHRLLIRDAIRAYLAPLPPPAAGEGLEPVAVKPLDWETKAGQDWSVAETPFGEYTVTRYVETDGVCWEGVYNDVGMVCQCGSEADAKAACQADFDRRIRFFLYALKEKT